MSEGRRVAQEIVVIRAALHQHGYSVHKRARQPVWAVYVTDNRFYLLTFQPTPISSWVLHPQDNSPDCCAIETIVQRALKKQFTGIVRRVQ